MQGLCAIQCLCAFSRRFLLLLREPCSHGCCALFPSVCLLSRAAGFVPASCGLSPAKPAHVVGNLPVLTVLCLADVRDVVQAQQAARTEIQHPAIP